MNGKGYFYRRIAKRQLKPDDSPDTQAFLPNDYEIKDRGGPSIEAADKITALSALGDYCRKHGNHLVVFPGKSVICSLHIKQTGRLSHHVILGWSYIKDDPNDFDLAYRIAHDARLCLRCKNDKVLQVEHGFF
jgi:hypothetical protein